ncbi:MAG: hypothetical protein MJ102_07620 [Clostridia bacterium]|nr:hypothetical protein [Clostridia bacterium]
MASKKKNKDNIIRIVISIIYIVLGAGSILDTVHTAFGSGSVQKTFEIIFAMDLASILTAVVGVIMFIAGIMGLCRINSSVCHTLGVFIFVAAGISLIWTIIEKNYSGLMTPLVQTLLSWLFIACI